jgi:diadenosine tetraphosphatase ApaH/serine/threonine PP2A family protein phosphatase
LIAFITIFAAFSDVIFGQNGEATSHRYPSNSHGIAPTATNNKENRNSSSNINVSTRNKKARKASNEGDHALTTRINDLENDLIMKDSVINALTARLSHFEDDFANTNQMNIDSNDNDMNMKTRNGREKSLGGGNILHRQHVMPTQSHIVDNDNITNAKIGTRESLLTARILQSAEKPSKTEGELIAERFVKIFNNYTLHLQYLNSKQFALDLMCMCEEVEQLLESEPRCVFMQSPVYIFGDIHGNIDDLQFFSENIWKMGMELTAGKFLFLGDYVDRGMMGLECVAYLFAQKLLHPHKIVMLRGNHETRDVNGWEEHYAEKAFSRQCKDRFGQQIGTEVWEECNQAFDRLPMAAVVDHDIFCVHGGLPRIVSNTFTNEIQQIMALPNVAAVMPSYEYEEEWMKQVAGDCIWSDPAGNNSGIRLNEDGFGESPRGGGAIFFGTKAIENFLQRNNLSYVIRAHEAHAQGVSLSNGARLFTVFSTSKDHRQGHGAMAGCILVDNYLIQVINRSPKYENKLVFGRERSRSSLLQAPGGGR